MNLQNWVEQARAHWKEFRPDMFKELEDAGMLEHELQTAATMTARAITHRHFRRADRGRGA